LATEGTVLSGSYRLELQKLAPQLDLIEQACPMWVPLVEAGELEGAGTEWFLHRYLDPLLSSPRSPERILLGCTHYPLLMEGIRKIVPASIAVISQAHVVSQGFRDWLLRHPEMERRLSRTGDCRVATTDDPEWFAQRGERILRRSLTVERAFLKAIR
jgi:glutamate racemase